MNQDPSDKETTAKGSQKIGKVRLSGPEEKPEGLPALEKLHHRTRDYALEAIKDDKVEMDCEDAFTVIHPRNQTITGVYFSVGHWRCTRCGGRVSELVPCWHMVAVFLAKEWIPRPSVDSTPSKNPDGRNWAAIRKADQNEEAEMPHLMRALADCLFHDHHASKDKRAILPDDVVYALLIWAWRRVKMDKVYGMLLTQPHFDHVRKPFTKPALVKFLKAEGAAEVLDRLLLISAAPAKHITFSGGPDGTGFHEGIGNPYFEERLQVKREEFQIDDAEGSDAAKRKRKYILAIPCIMYETNVVPALAVQSRDSKVNQQRVAQGKTTLTGESPWLIPLFIRTRTVFKRIQEVQADKGLSSGMNALYCQHTGLQEFIPQVKRDKVGQHTGRGAAQRAYRSAGRKERMNPEEFSKAYHKRSNQEGVMNGVKASLGGGVKARIPESKENEIRLRYIVYNLRQLLILKYGHDLEIDFRHEAYEVDAEPWVSLLELRSRFRGPDAEAEVLRLPAAA